MPWYDQLRDKSGKPVATLVDNPKPTPSLEPSAPIAPPMHPRDWRLFFYLGIPGALAVAVFSVGLGAFVTGSPHWGFGLCAASAVVLGLIAVYLLDKKPKEFKPPYPFVALTTIAVLTWIFIGWQTWLWIHSPFQGYTQAQLDAAVAKAKAEQPPGGLTQQQVNEKIAEATASIQKQLDQVTGQRDVANDRVRQLEALQHAPPAPPLAADGPRVFTDKTKEQIWDTYCESRTELQCSILMNEEKNKWITLRADVAIIHAGGNMGLSGGVICNFGNEWIPALSTFRTGDPVTITGQIVGFNVRFFILQRCEIKSPS